MKNVECRMKKDKIWTNTFWKEMIEEERRRNQRKQHLQQQRDSYRAASSMNRASQNVPRVSSISSECR